MRSKAKKDIEKRRREILLYKVSLICLIGIVGVFFPQPVTAILNHIFGEHRLNEMWACLIGLAVAWSGWEYIYHSKKFIGILWEK